MSMQRLHIYQRQTNNV